VIEINIHREASRELEATVEFYEFRLEGLGVRFLSAVENGLTRISEFPESGSQFDRDLRKAVVAGFPFSIIYQETTHDITVIAVAHNYRRPGYWSNRF